MWKYATVMLIILHSAAAHAQAGGQEKLIRAIKSEQPGTIMFLRETMTFCKDAATPSMARQIGPACEEKLAMAKTMARSQEVRSEIDRLDNLRLQILIMDYGDASKGAKAASDAVQGYYGVLSAIEASALKK